MLTSRKNCILLWGINCGFCLLFSTVEGDNKFSCHWSYQNDCKVKKCKRKTPTIFAKFYLIFYCEQANWFCIWLFIPYHTIWQTFSAVSRATQPLFNVIRWNRCCKACGNIKMNVFFRFILTWLPCYSSKTPSWNNQFSSQ